MLLYVCLFVEMTVNLAWSYLPAHTDTFLQVSQVYKNIYIHLGQITRSSSFSRFPGWANIDLQQHIFLFYLRFLNHIISEHQTLLDIKHM